MRRPYLSRGLDTAVDEENGELVASPAKAGVGDAHGAPQGLSRTPQSIVARQVAQVVLDGF
jgi:hypothetical protein